MVHYAQSRHIDTELYRNAIILSDIDRTDSVTLKRIGTALHMSHLIDCVTEESLLSITN